MGFETSPLGYPVGDHTVLTGPDGNPWGDVQAFAGGALYRRYGHPGYPVWGQIRESWARSGFENGLLGWPTSFEARVGDTFEQKFEKGRILWSANGILLSPVDGEDRLITPAH